MHPAEKLIHRYKLGQLTMALLLASHKNLARIMEFFMKAFMTPLKNSTAVRVGAKDEKTKGVKIPPKKEMSDAEKSMRELDRTMREFGVLYKDATKEQKDFYGQFINKEPEQILADVKAGIKADKESLVDLEFAKDMDTIITMFNKDPEKTPAENLLEALHEGADLPYDLLPAEMTSMIVGAIQVVAGEVNLTEANLKDVKLPAKMDLTKLKDEKGMGANDCRAQMALAVFSVLKQMDMTKPAKELTAEMQTIKDMQSAYNEKLTQKDMQTIADNKAELRTSLEEYRLLLGKEKRGEISLDEAKQKDLLWAKIEALRSQALSRSTVSKTREQVVKDKALADKKQQYRDKILEDEAELKILNESTTELSDKDKVYKQELVERLNENRKILNNLNTGNVSYEQQVAKEKADAEKQLNSAQDSMTRFKNATEKGHGHRHVSKKRINHELKAELENKLEESQQVVDAVQAEIEKYNLDLEKPKVNEENVMKSRTMEDVANEAKSNAEEEQKKAEELKEKQAKDEANHGTMSDREWDTHISKTVTQPALKERLEAKKDEMIANREERRAKKAAAEAASPTTPKPSEAEMGE